MAEQLSLWDETCFNTAPKRELPAPREFTESKEDYERRRTTEMAEKLGWPALHIGPIHRWAGLTLAEGEDAWHAFLRDAPESTIGVVMITIHKQLDPLFFGCIDEKTGLQQHPVEVVSRVEERHRAYMLDLAEALDWPRVQWWDSDEKRTLGPGREVWQKYHAYGCCGVVSDLTQALERLMRGEPESRKRRRYEEYNEDE